MQFKLLAALVATAFLVACGGGGDSADKGGDKAAPAAKAEGKKKKKDSNLAGWETLSNDRLVVLGKTIFLTQGGNTCNDCHGTEGHSGRLKEAADLRKPSTWKATKATGGDAAKLEARLLALIENGAGVWNETHPDDKYDINMMGVTQSATKSTLKKIKKELKKKDKVRLGKDDLAPFGAKAVYAYVLTLKNEAAAAAPAAPAAPAAAPPTGEAKPAEAVEKK
jgi:hypothetical protein